MQQKSPVYRAFYTYTVADPTGLEPATSCVTGMRSNQLSYGSIHLIYGQEYGTTQVLSMPCFFCGGDWNRTSDLGLMSPTL